MSTLTPSVGLLKAIIARIPLILKTIIQHGVHMSPVSGRQDLRTELLVAVFRSFMTFSHSITQTQKNSMRDPGVKGPMWISKVVLPKPEIDVRNAVLHAIDDLKTGDESFDIPDIASVEAEWTGYRSGVDKNATLPDISETEKYHELRKESPSDTTILYFHGGAYFLMDPCTHRAAVAQLSRQTGSPVLSVRYRLAPQNPFPAALVDALTAYLSLIHPPPGALHDPVPANKIVIAGDSAGGNLSLVLLQTLLTLQRASRSITFHGKDIPVELPAGVATISPWCDITHSMPSAFHNAKFDYLVLPTFEGNEKAASLPFAPAPFPPDAVWPTSPPRSDLYVNAKTVLHPLVSPIAASPDLWKNAPPVFISAGEECLTDDSLITARRMHEAGVPVVAEQFEGMPHCHGFLMISTPVGRRFFKALSGFCQDAGAGRVESTGQLTYLGFKLKSTRQIPLDKVSDLSEKEVDQRLQRSAEWRLEGEKEMLRREGARL